MCVFVLQWFEDAKLQSAVDVIACCFTLFQACIASSIDKTSEDRCAVLVSACGFMSCLLAAAVRQCAQLEACGELSVQASPAIRPATVATASLEHMPDLALAVEFDISIDAPMKRRKAVAPQPAATLEQRTLILPMATSAAANVHQLIITVLEQIFNCFSTLLRGFRSDNVSDAIATCTQAILLSPFNDVLCKHLQ